MGLDTPLEESKTGKSTFSIIEELMKRDVARVYENIKAGRIPHEGLQCPFPRMFVSHFALPALEHDLLDEELNTLVILQKAASTVCKGVIQVSS